MSFRLPLAAVALLAAPALSQPLYRATLAAAASQTMMVRETRFVCAGTACAAPRAGDASDPGICAGIARRAGPLLRFEAGARVFDAAELARCNAAAR